MVDISLNKDAPIILDDFLTEEQVKIVLKEINDTKLQHTGGVGYRNWRFYYDALEDRSKSEVLNIFDNIWSLDRLKNAMEERNSYAFELMKGADFDNTTTKIEGPEDECRWHKNDWGRSPGSLILCNWLYYLKPKNNYTGGELEYSFDNIRQKKDSWNPESEPVNTTIIDNKHNRFVIFPAYYWHRVRPLNFTSFNNIFDGRLAINGHVGFKLANNYDHRLDNWA